VSVAATLTLQEGHLQRMRLALGGIGAVPFRVDHLVHQFTGLRPTMQWAQEVADAVGLGVQPQEDERIPAVYKKELARSLTLRAVLRTLEKLGVTTHE
jgi:carbon-monoxide dehydrogenase medium subunit